MTGDLFGPTCLCCGVENLPGLMLHSGHIHAPYARLVIPSVLVLMELRAKLPGDLMIFTSLLQ